MLTEEQILTNWERFMTIISTEIHGDRLKILNKFYEENAERFSTMPASGNEKFHNAFPGGYIAHVLGVYSNACELWAVWKKQGAFVDDFKYAELVFCALNHDLGKFGNEDQEYYVPQTSDWHKNRGEIFIHNPQLSFMKTSDRSLYILQSLGIRLSENEFLGIKLHDGLYEESNKSYLVSYSDAYRLQSSLAYILHQADLMASRIEYDNVNRKSQYETATFKIDPKNMSKTNLPGINNSLVIESKPNLIKENSPKITKKKAQGKYAHLLNK